MPGFDGTGPSGMGSMTGRGRGYCLSYVNDREGFVPGFGRGAGRGRGYCFYSGSPRMSGWRRGFPAGAVYVPPVSGEQELEALKAQVGNLESALEQTRKRIHELEHKA
ncbi:MAG: DUF5320 domain-containing protein [Firmicutes bacterium]|nr:DUF5320 domain-containing protein [Bacillota bacterium]